MYVVVTLSYAVEASNMASTIALLCHGNPALGDRIQIINRPLESIEDDEVPEKVDVLISEPIGTFLFNERMIETYLSARDRFLKPEGQFAFAIMLSFRKTLGMAAVRGKEMWCQRLVSASWCGHAQKPSPPSTT